MQLLGAAVNIDQKEVVQEQILHEAVLVVAFLESAHQPLELESRHAPDQQGTVRLAVYHDDILQLLLVHHLKELVRSG